MKTFLEKYKGAKTNFQTNSRYPVNFDRSLKFNYYSLRPNIRDGSKFMGYPGRDHRQGAKTFFEKKLGGADFFQEKLGGADFFSEKNRGRRVFFEKY